MELISIPLDIANKSSKTLSKNRNKPFLNLNIQFFLALSSFKMVFLHQQKIGQPCSRQTPEEHPQVFLDFYCLTRNAP